jgi:hypothetical protein
MGTSPKAEYARIDRAANAASLSVRETTSQLRPQRFTNHQPGGLHSPPLHTIHPKARIAAAVEYSKDHDRVSIEHIEHSEWKSMQQCTAHRPVNHCEPLGMSAIAENVASAVSRNSCPSPVRCRSYQAADSAESCSACGRRRTSTGIGGDEYLKSRLSQSACDSRQSHTHQDSDPVRPSDIHERVLSERRAPVAPQLLSRATSIGNPGIRTQAQPAAKGPPQVARSENGERAASKYSVDCNVPHPHTRHGPQRRANL